MEESNKCKIEKKITPEKSCWARNLLSSMNQAVVQAAWSLGEEAIGGAGIPGVVVDQI